MRIASFAVAVTGLTALPGALAWGAAGHEIVATIAQVYLHPTVLPNICHILNFTDPNPNAPLCHLAPVSTWADRLRFRMRWSAALHYVGALDDYPGQRCEFPGERGWAGSKGGNVLGGIRNVTGLLERWGEGETGEEMASEALKFLVHFVGDMHMPLHLTGRDRGGNSDKVLWGGRQTNLHSLWDGLLIAKAVRTVPRNYSLPLPYPQIEGALRGTIYDSYIRRIFWEGLLNEWVDEKDGWLACPTPKEVQQPQGALQQLMSLVGMNSARDVAGETDDEFVCPYAWAQPIHKLNCEIVWPKELDEPPYTHMRIAEERERRSRLVDTHDPHSHSHDEGLTNSPDELLGAHLAGPQPKYVELDTPAYSGVITKKKVVEKLLAQGGIRLAGVLNYLFADEGMGIRQL
ncbi:phospholipase C/P1 nuclease domain-containing protein [Crucibulum laeve]|uniref:Phospholipase C/P1 nuclease domain-containing protein n=1 Tax=Crucibulum laeve TaxID=68775 RepID=A0A5C3MAL4_9AGAR|nr:phospholipase C/P1 nuclease domain-containing protein [Crucibulum laeve]